MQTVTLKTDHPLARALWIWPEYNIYLNNCYAHFRYDFEMESVPGKEALFHITADQWYRLYVNGKYAGAGPERGLQADWHFDSYDLKGYLHPGRNFIAVEAYNPGCSSASYEFMDIAAFICAAEWDNGTKIYSHPETWKMRRSPANRQYLARIVRQMGFQEEFDARLDDRSWITSPEPPDWKLGRNMWCCRAFGSYPYYRMHPREIPFMRERYISCGKLVESGTGTTAGGWEQPFSIYDHWYDSERLSSVPGDMLTEKDGAILVPPAEDGKFRYAVLDLERVQFGRWAVEVENALGGEMVDCFYYQYIKDHDVRNLPLLGMNAGMTPGNRFIAAPGTSRRRFMHTMGARFLVMVFRNITQTVTVKTNIRTLEYPFSMRGKFETSDEELNSIMTICRHTQQICGYDTYMDTPWREQSLYAADSQYQAAATVFLDGDLRLFKRGIRLLTEPETQHGLTVASAPTGYELTIPDFSLSLIQCAYEYYWHTGDLSLYHETKDSCKGILDYFRRWSDNQYGLVEADSSVWIFGDWGDLPRTGYPALQNLWYLRTVQYYHKLLLADGDAEAENIGRLAQNLAQRMKEAYFDKESGLVLGGLDENGRRLTCATIHDQAAAIMTGLAPEAQKSMIEKRILPFLNGEKGDWSGPSSAWCARLFEAVRDCGVEKELVEFIRRHWLKMVPFGSTWEDLFFDEELGHSICHAWSAHPARFLPELILGIRQTAVAWKEMSCTPLEGLLPENGSFLLPSPAGDFCLDWDAEMLTVTVPAGMKCRFTYAGETKELEDTVFMRKRIRK